MKPLLIFLLFCFSMQLSAAQEDQDPIVVRLATDVQLLPLYMASFKTDENGISTDYSRSLEKVLSFDLDHNGMTYLLKKSAEKERLSLSKEVDFTSWMKENVYFVVTIEIKEKLLNAKLIVVNSHITKKVEGLSLSGNLNQDRRVMHSLADLIHKALFDTDGIASTRILYTYKAEDSSHKKWVSTIYEADYDGHNARRLLQDDSYCVTPSYIPPKPGFKSGSCVFVSYKIGQPKIYLAQLQDGQAQRFSLLKGNQLMPTISRQKDKIAFISDVTGNPDLFIQDFDPEKGAIGKPRQIYATHRATQGTPSFSPDGNRLAFVSNKDGSPKIYVITIPEPGVELKDIKATLITKVNRENSAPCWSPDGTKIAYCAKTKGTRQIWVYDFLTGTERQLTQGLGNKENPTWAPNSLHLIFNSSDAGASELYLINLNQPEATRISFGPGEKHFPSWEIRN